MHAVSIQGTVLACGVFLSFWGPQPGSWNDKRMLLESDLLSAIAQADANHSYQLLGDKGYASDRCIITTYGDKDIASDPRKKVRLLL